ncbi:hypothetical protein [Phytobacter massiliensis]|uniref:hypothetical protein n=2 Tax=Phytobacter massiliensis TaxID=1485952 RepID=UPI00030AA0CB|nr:hypothetical protein [Phytobacter massiliensis]
MSRIWGVAAALVSGLAVIPTQAATWSYNYTWHGGLNAGLPAANCTLTVPDIRPLQVPKTLVVDSAAPIGAVLYSWDFNSFLPGFMSRCTGTGINTYGHGSMVIDGIEVANINRWELFLRGLTISEPKNNSIPTYATTLSGIGIRLYVRADTDDNSESLWQEFLYAGGLGVISSPVRGNAYVWGYGSPGVDSFFRADLADGFIMTDKEAGFSIKAELIKTADTVQYGNLGLAGNPVTAWETDGISTALPTDLLSGNAITVVSPACRLRTTNYNISMGTWAADTINHTGTPASGPAQPVGLDLECMGRPADVQFRFEDTGSAPSTAAQKNVTLYDGGGNKVNGLEIQMKYNGSRVNIDGVTQTSTGARGQAHDNSGLAPTYIAAGQAMFTANYIQNGPITVGGNNYTGPVSGKVNVWVTYN